MTDDRQKRDPKTTLYRLSLCTWNVASASPDGVNIDKLLGLTSHTALPHIIGIGLQEVSGLSGDGEKHEWTEYLTKSLATRTYVRLKTIKMQGLLLIVFVQRRVMANVSNIETEYTPTGFSGLWGNKGGVTLRMDINGVNFCIVNSHLAAHLAEIEERVEDAFSIIQGQKFRDKDTDNLLDHDYVFWFGDLNFRITGLQRWEVLHQTEHRKFDFLIKYDQLIEAREEGLAFLDFKEGPLTFPPTYKYDIGTDNYDSSEKKRIPAWCDRILWHVHEDAFEGMDLAVKQLSYYSRMDFRISDHKPVMAEFEFTVFAHPPPSPVLFHPISRWYMGQSQGAMYNMSASTETSSWDWIVLLPADFKDFTSYASYVYATVEETDTTDSHACHRELTVVFPSSKLEVPSGKYYLAYISHYKDSLLGMSEEFEIVP